jgi:ABC-2 type transport system ATP-binding protein
LHLSGFFPYHEKKKQTAPVIELREVVKRYGAFTAVDHVSLTVEKGEFFGFLGPNGAGKTTTIKMMTGLLRPTSGACLIHGIDVQKHPVAAKNAFGYVPDQPFLYDKLTGREFLHFIGGLFKLDMPTIHRMTDQLIEQFELGPFVDKYAEEFSQGMRQRMALAGALLHGPQVLIIDEPLLGLDPHSAWLVKEILKQKAGEGTTVFMSTHLLRIAEELCDRIVIIKGGKIIYEEHQNAAWDNRGRLEKTFLELTRS